MNRSTLLVLFKLAALATLIMVSTLAGCGPAYRVEASRAPREPEGSVDDYRARIERFERELNEELRTDRAPTLRPDSRPTIGEPDREPGPPPRRKPDCRAAPDLRSRICELAQRICAIAERDARESTVAQTCERAREACDQATLRVQRACGGG